MGRGSWHNQQGMDQHPRYLRSGSRYVNYSTGVSAVIRPDHMAKRLLALDGGYLDFYNSYSTASVRFATPYMYGTDRTGNGFEDWLNSKLIILWGHNPAETIFDAGTMHYLRMAKKKGIPSAGAILSTTTTLRCISLTQRHYG